MSELLSQSQFAAHRGVSRQTVTRWKKQGYLVWQGDKIDRDASDELLDSRGPPKNGSAPADEPEEPAAAAAEPLPDVPAQSEASLHTLTESTDLLSEAEAKRVKENYLALQRRLEYERQAGELVRIDDVEREHAERCQRLRSQILALPNEVAAGIAQEIGGNANEVRGLVQDKVNDVLEELAHGHGGSS